MAARDAFLSSARYSSALCIGLQVEGGEEKETVSEKVKARESERDTPYGEFARRSMGVGLQIVEVKGEGEGEGEADLHGVASCGEAFLG